VYELGIEELTTFEVRAMSWNDWTAELVEERVAPFVWKAARSWGSDCPTAWENAWEGVSLEMENMGGETDEVVATEEVFVLPEDDAMKSS